LFDAVVDDFFEGIKVADVDLRGDDPAVEILDMSAVSARSWGVDPSAGESSNARQMSTAMMSAPSWASRTAWLRP
jgi:hypothetical protein